MNHTLNQLFDVIVPQFRDSKPIDISQLKVCLQTVSADQLLDMLVSAGFNYGQYALTIAAEKGHIELINSIFEHIQKPKKRLKLLFHKFKRETIIQRTATAGQLQTMKYLISAAPRQYADALLAEPCIDDQTILHLAARGGNVAMMKYILNKISADRAGVMLRRKRFQGETIVHCAVRSNKVQMIEFVLRKTTEDVDKLLMKQNIYGYTALMMSAQWQQLECIRCLLRHCSPSRQLALLNLKSKGGSTAAELAAVGGKPETAKYLRQQSMRAPTLTSSNLPKVIQVKAGQPLSHEIPFTGTDPLILWTKDGSTLEPRHKVKTEKDRLVLTIDKTEQADSGAFNVKLSNDVGEVECQIVIRVVFGKPGSPEDIIPAEIRADSLLIRWKKPTDDGGQPIFCYFVESKNMTVYPQTWSKSGQTSTEEFRANKLRKGDKYKFRVCAVNSEGQGPWMEYKGIIKAKDPYDLSSAPTHLNASQIETSNVKLSWKAPASDCGTHVKQYIIEAKMPKEQDWIKMKEVLTFSTTVTGLKENTQYQFRVKAVNNTGESDSQELTIPITTKRQLHKPKIDARHWNNIVQKIGQPFELQCKYKGVPEPTVKWFRSDKVVAQELVATKNMTTAVKVNDSQRHHTGCYRVVVRNHLGKATATCKVVIRGPPGRPELPLAVQDVAAESALLSWQKPTGNGGDDVLNYVIEKLDTSAGDWEKVDSVPGNTAKLKVTNLIDGHNYMFRVRAENIHGQSAALVTGNATKAKEPLNVPAAPEGPVGFKDMGDSYCLSWKCPKCDGGSGITNYIVEKKTVGSKKWKKVHSFATESHCPIQNLQVGKQYKFRVVAENQIGQSKPLITTTNPILVKVPVEWEPPLRNGDHPVTSYAVEQRLKGDSKCTNVSRDIVNEGSATARKLLPSNVHEFRVCALNEAGASEWNKSSNIVEACYTTADKDEIAGEENELRDNKERITRELQSICAVDEREEGKKEANVVSVANIYKQDMEK